MRMLRELSFRRSVLCCAERKVQLHGFADSSGVAYCAVIYVKVTCSHEVSCNLWTARSRLVPTKHCLMPRLELLSCLLLSELMVIVKNAVEGEVKIERIYCWSDSQVALWLVKSENKLSEAWVQRRVEKIRKNVGNYVWRYVKTNENPADIGTREKSLKLFNENVWRYRTNFLYNNESQKFITSKVSEMKEKSNGECILISKVETSELG